MPSLDIGVYSLNVPVPSRVGKLAGELAQELPQARARRRDEHTLVCKRLGTADESYHHIEARAREEVTGTAPFAARVTGIDQFPEASAGPSPVVYLVVESRGLRRLHERLCSAFDPIEGFEADEYDPHVTIARGGSRDRAREMCSKSIDPIEWQVTELAFRDSKRGQAVSTVSLPA